MKILLMISMKHWVQECRLSRGEKQQEEQSNSCEVTLSGDKPGKLDTPRKNCFAQLTQNQILPDIVHVAFWATTRVPLGAG